MSKVIHTPQTTTDKQTTNNRGNDVVKNTEAITDNNRVNKGLPKLTRKQKLYADYLLNNPKASHTQAVAHAYDKTTYGTQRLIASENISKPNIQLYLENHGYTALADMIEIANYSKTLGKQGDKSGAAYASVAVAANRDIMDRAYGKATQRTEVVSQSISVNIDLTGKVTDEGAQAHRDAHREK